MVDTHNTICDKVGKFNRDSTPHQTISSHTICPLDHDITYNILNITNQNMN